MGRGTHWGRLGGVWGGLPGGRGSRVRDGHNSASREGAQRPSRAVTSTVTMPAEREKLSLLPW